MFNGLIEKSTICGNIQILIPINKIDNDILILISHGSGGLGIAEFTTAEYFLSNGYRVGLLDYFSAYNISNLWWNHEEKFMDAYQTTFSKMLTHFDLPYEYKIVHIGFSLGGFLGIINSNRYFKNYCFYPGIIGFTDNLVCQDFSNTTVFNALRDQWCSYYEFEQNCKIPPRRIDLDACHGFMIHGKNKIVQIAKYKLLTDPISNSEFCKLKPCHIFLANKYGYEKKEIRLLYDQESKDRCLDIIIKDLQ